MLIFSCNSKSDTVVDAVIEGKFKLNYEPFVVSGGLIATFIDSLNLPDRKILS